MSFVTLGRSGLRVSRACLGTMTFGNTEWGTDETESQRIVDAFIDAGHNFIDTADVYNAGASEEIVGRAIKARRDDVVLATKGYNVMGAGPNDRGSSRAHLTRELLRQSAGRSSVGGGPSECDAVRQSAAPVLAPLA
jgi:aryl-alcohol dehydrogenase-like predicted oxidoreductase